jgi:D-alanyl-lipoteichoic acid acyltransferase DltB (MBOAT superfamily)
MSFNSIEFAIFLPIVFIAYWLLKNKNLRYQNILLLIASYVFYGWWDLRLLSLLIILSVSNYLIGIYINKNEIDRKRKNWMIAGLVINLGVLVIFKYFNFFIDSFIDLLSLAGYNLPRSTTKIILPVGISFYVFLSLSYILDIYKRTLNADKNIIEVLLSLGFFPIILAGPIQRPSTLIPQISQKREFNYDQTFDGLGQILWGLFVKVVIADNLALYADDFFHNYSNYSGSTLLLGAVFYTIQIYADFSGYSNMAIGVAKLFGFSLMRNFAYPYFSRDITEFWKRWHISLTTWFRDYLFLPLSFAVSWKIKGSKVFYIKTDLFIYIVASTVTWFLTGLWHGANYTYILWGMIHGLLLIVYHIQRNPRKKLFKKIGITNDHLVIRIFETIITLFVVIIAWIFFRADNISIAIKYLSNMFSSSLFTYPTIFPVDLIVIILLFIMTEWISREKLHPFQFDSNKKLNIVLRPVLISIVIWAIILWGAFKNKEFIYFHF